MKNLKRLVLNKRAAPIEQVLTVNAVGEIGADRRTLTVNPFVSEDQRAWMYANHPAMAKKWQKHTPKGKKLPKKVKNVRGRAPVIVNRRVPNPLKVDPTKTATLRRAFSQKVRAQFAKLKGRIIKLVVDEDAFGLNRKPGSPGALASTVDYAHPHNANNPSASANDGLLVNAKDALGHGSDARGAAGDKAVEDKVSSLKDVLLKTAGSATEVPRGLMRNIQNKAKEKYEQLSSRYGTKYAKAIIGAAVLGLPLPVPGSSLVTAAPMIALAEMHKWASGRAKPAVVGNVNLFTRPIVTSTLVSIYGKQLADELHTAFDMKPPAFTTNAKDALGHGSEKRGVDIDKLPVSDAVKDEFRVAQQNGSLKVHDDGTVTLYRGIGEFGGGRHADKASAIKEMTDEGVTDLGKWWSPSKSTGEHYGNAGPDDGMVVSIKVPLHTLSAHGSHEGVHTTADTSHKAIQEVHVRKGGQWITLNASDPYRDALGRFASGVNDAAKDSPTGKFGDNKTFISHVHEQYNKQQKSQGKLPQTLDQFKGNLLKAQKAGLVKLSRLDLPHLADSKDVSASETSHGLGSALTGSYHLVQHSGTRNAFNPDQERDEQGRWASSGVSVMHTKIDSETMFSEQGQDEDKLASIRASTPKGGPYTAGVAMRKDDGDLEIMDGHHRASIAEERGDTMPMVTLHQRDVERLTKAGYSHPEIVHAALTKAGHLGEAAQVGDKLGVTARGHEAAKMLDRLPDSSQKEARNVANTRWTFRQDSEKIKAFQEWLEQQLSDLVTSDAEEAMWNAYIQQGFEKGAGKAFDDWMARRRDLGTSEKETLGEFYRGTREEFMRSSFAKPEAIDKVKLLAGRAFDDLDGVTSDMSVKISRSLTDGLVQGQNPKDIARGMTDVVDVSRDRAELIARTEIIRAHAEGQLNSFEELGVDEVGVAAEWSTADDFRVCDECEPLEGVVLSVDEAKGMLPRHPNCRCAWLPANVGEDDEDQKRSKREIQAAIRESDPDGDDWEGSDKVISRSRPKSVFIGNVRFNPYAKGTHRRGVRNEYQGAWERWLSRFPVQHVCNH